MPSDLRYKGQRLTDYIGVPAASFERVFGRIEDNVGEVPYAHYGWCFTGSGVQVTTTDRNGNETGRIQAIRVAPDAVTVNGINMDKSVSQLRNYLGAPYTVDYWRYRPAWGRYMDIYYLGNGCGVCFRGGEDSNYLDDVIIYGSSGFTPASGAQPR